VNIAVKVMDTVLRDDFGFRNILFVYSGRRGMHCWVSDPKARSLENAQRAAVVEYIAALAGGGGGGEAGSDKGGKSSMRPWIMLRSLPPL
jgi:DNA primase catalytic subunit